MVLNLLNEVKSSQNSLLLVRLIQSICLEKKKKKIMKIMGLGWVAWVAVFLKRSLFFSFNKTNALLYNWSFKRKRADRFFSHNAFYFISNLNYKRYFYNITSESPIYTYFFIVFFFLIFRIFLFDFLYF